LLTFTASAPESATSALRAKEDLMTGRLRVAMGLCLGLGLIVTLVMPLGAQEKAPDKGKTALKRVEGAIQSIDKATNTLTVRLRGKTNTQAVVYNDKTMFTFRNKPASVDEVKEGRNVICLGTPTDKAWVAARIDVRDEK
jgi:hypothetical protein